MRFAAILALALLAAPANAQTTGTNAFNGYSVHARFFPNVYNLTSCATRFIVTPSGVAPLVFSVWAKRGRSTFILVSFAPCVPNSVPLPTCSGTTLDLSLVPSPFVLAFGTTDGYLGRFDVIVSMPPLPSGFSFSSQAVIIDPTNCGSLPLFTPAWDITVL